MKRALVSIAVLLVVRDAGAQSQPDTTAKNKTVATTGCFVADKWYEVFEIRKAFDGAAEEKDAGSIGVVSPGKESKTYFFLDAGIRTKPCEFYIGKKTATNYPPLVIWYPAVEWHHMSAEPLQDQEATN